MKDKKALFVGLAGLGVVGSGLCRVIAENADIIEKRAGRPIVIKKILVRDTHKVRNVQLPDDVTLTDSMENLVEDDSLDAIVELMGGLGAASRLITAALEHGKHVVTANKALLAEDGIKLLDLAVSKNLILRYEASVAGAVPVVAALKESLTGNRVHSLVGILNGTSNYILSEMSANGLDFDMALRQAQELGYAEAEPSLDIDGQDAAHKLIILIRLAFGLDYPYSKLSVRGIRDISSLDIRFAREFGYRIKLIGQAAAITTPEGKAIAAGVFPALVHHTFLLARVGGAYNGLRVSANASGPLFFHGRGAGSLPTAGAVLADLIAVARNELPNNSGFAVPLAKANILPADDWRSCYYVRLMVSDTPGVLRDISGCLADENISIAQMIQKSELEARGVPLVFMTHETSQRAMKNALERVQAAGLVREEPVYFRVLEKEQII